MDLIPTKRTGLAPESGARSHDGIGRGMEFALVVLAFLGAGYLLDRWFGTKPVFMIILVVLSLVGQFANLWYGYDARMKEFEAERAANATVAGRRRRGSTEPASTATASTATASTGTGPTGNASAGPASAGEASAP